MNARITTAAVLFVTAAGCSGAKDPAPIDARGSYATSGTWSVGGPLADGRTPGDVTAELLVESIVDLAGVPSFAEEEAREIVADAIAADVAASVDANLPPELQEGSALRLGLAATLGDVDYDGTLVIGDGLTGDSLRGNETISRLHVTKDGVTYELLPDVIAATGPLGGSWDGDPQGGAGIEVGAHGVGIRFGALVRWAAIEVLGEAAIDGLSAQAATAVVCADVTDAVLDGSATFGVVVGAVTYELTAGQIENACAAARAEVGDRVLGMFDYGLLELGGDLTLDDADRDGRTDTVRSAPGFGGLLFLPPLPDPLAPRVSASFTGTRE